MKIKKRERQRKYCLLWGLNPRPSGAQENRGKLAHFGAKKYSLKMRTALRVFYLKKNEIK